MPFKPKPNCKTCALVKADKTLLDRLNRSRPFIPGGESLSSLSRELMIPYKSLDNHLKRHQAPTKSVLEKKMKQAQTKDAFKEITTQAQRGKLNAYIAGNSGGARSELIDKLLDMADRGELKMSGSNLVSLLSQAQKEEEAAKDRQFELMKMFRYFNAQAGNPDDYKKYSEADDGAEEGEVVSTGTPD